MTQLIQSGVARAAALFLVVAMLLVAAVATPILRMGRQLSVPAEYVPLIDAYGTHCASLTPARLAAQLYQESKFDPDAVSSDGALGLAQFMPATWMEHGVDASGDGLADPTDPTDAIATAAAYDCYIAEIVAAVPGDLVANMLAAYNAGPQAVIDHGGVPPYVETERYVARIKSLENALEGLLS